jgi:hypothetical protein
MGGTTEAMNIERVCRGVTAPTLSKLGCATRRRRQSPTRRQLFTPIYPEISTVQLCDRGWGGPPIEWLSVSWSSSCFLCRFLWTSSSLTCEALLHLCAWGSGISGANIERVWQDVSTDHIPTTDHSRLITTNQACGNDLAQPTGGTAAQPKQIICQRSIPRMAVRSG